MRIGIIGLGLVGGTLKKWFDNNMNHEIVIKDIKQNINDDFNGIMACFICINVQPGPKGQDQTNLEECVKYAKEYTPNVFIRSTVLPGTNDRLGTIAMPEFLTARRAYEDMQKLPILIGTNWIVLKEIFGKKEIIQMSNTEAEMAKYFHNCYGAMKVTYFNMIENLCTYANPKLNFEQVKRGMFITGFIEKEHTMVPGPDGKFGYNGSCFPTNIESLRNWCETEDLKFHAGFFGLIHGMNEVYRNKQTKEFEGVPI